MLIVKVFSIIIIIVNLKGGEEWGQWERLEFSRSSGYWKLEKVFI